LILLLGMDNVNLIGTSVCPADCYLKDGLTATLKILKLFKKNIPVAKGTLFGRNPFPSDWRILTFKANLFPLMMSIEEDESLV